MGRHIDGLDCDYRECSVGQMNSEERTIMEFCLEENFMCIKYMVCWGRRKVTFRMGENDTKSFLCFVLIRNEHLRFA